MPPGTAWIRLHRAAAVPPAPWPLHCQRRWDTSPYRRVHQLTWTHLNRARWPENGSLAWHPTWGFQKPLLPTSLSAPRAVTPPLTAAPPLHWEPGPQRLKKRLQDALGLSAQEPRAASTNDSSQQVRVCKLWFCYSQGCFGAGAEALSTKKVAEYALQNNQYWTLRANWQTLGKALLSRVTVDGQIQSKDRWIEDRHEITVNGHPLSEISGISFVAHKPAGLLGNL
eukprot:s5908_g3.t2